MTESSTPRVVRGSIRLPSKMPPGIAAQIVVRVEDVSRADAPSIVIGEQRLATVSICGGDSVPFAIQVPAERIDDRGSYSVSAHIDLGGSGQVETGDFISTQTYPVLSRQYPDDVDVEVRPV